MKRVKVVILAVFVAICMFSLSFAAVYGAEDEPQNSENINITEDSETGETGDTEPEERLPVHIEMHIGRTVKAETDIADGIWKSDNPEIATVTSKGKIKGIKHGKCVITHTDSENPENVQIYNVTVKKEYTAGGADITV